MKLSRLAFAFLAASIPAVAQAAPTLKPEIVVDGPIVTLGDLVMDAGTLAATPLFRAPDPGRTGRVAASDVAERARAAGLSDLDLAGLDAVTVQRSSAAVTGEEIEAMIRDRIVETSGIPADRLSIAFDHPPTTVHADTRAETPVRLGHLATARNGIGRFEVELTVETDGTPTHILLAGTATEVVEIVTPAASIERGAIIRPADLRVDRVPARPGLQLAAATRPADLVGLAARRPLAPGTPLTKADGIEPMLVERGTLVTMVFRSRGLTLSVRAKALESGSAGDTVSVQNVQSKRIVQATVADRGLVEVVSGPRNVAALETRP